MLQPPPPQAEGKAFIICDSSGTNFGWSAGTTQIST